MTDVQIVDYSAEYGDAFARLNIEWLEKYFYVEPIDYQVLNNPQHILDEGGSILYALSSGVAIGAVALKHHGAGVYELTKMAVTDGHQGEGIGRRLLYAVIERWHDVSGSTLFLESHSSLLPALHLYESAGFVRKPRPRASDYERSNVYMVYHGDA